mgnify:FL=1
MKEEIKIKFNSIGYTRLTMNIAGNRMLLPYKTRSGSVRLNWSVY